MPIIVAHNVLASLCGHARAGASHWQAPATRARSWLSVCGLARSSVKPGRLIGGLLAALLAVAAPSASAKSGHEPIIAVAASVAAAGERIAQRFHAKTGIHVRWSAGASGNLARQIQRGAPFELFISADRSYVGKVIESGLNDGPGVTYAIGQLALLIGQHSGLARPAAQLAAAAHKDEIARLLRDPRIERITMANPQHAPYGRAARESLQFLGVWQTLKSKAVFGESVAQSARFATTHSVQAALLPLGIIIHSQLADEPHWIVPTDWHQPLHQQMILIKGASDEAKQLFAFMQGAQAHDVLREFGFLVPASR